MLITVHRVVKPCVASLLMKALLWLKAVSVVQCIERRIQLIIIEQVMEFFKSEEHLLITKKEQKDCESLCTDDMGTSHSIKKCCS